MSSKYVIFDLDDTLVCEIDYLKSAYRAIASLVVSEAVATERLYKQMICEYQEGRNAFEYVAKYFPHFSMEQLLQVYRNHFPVISLNEGAQEVLVFCKAQGFKIGLITDGRSVTQRNKLRALGIEALFDKIVISEEFGRSKPDLRNYEVFTEKDIKAYCYIGDNPAKDFIAPNILGWTSYCLLNKGWNIHPQDFEVAPEQQPTYIITELKDLIHTL